MVDKIKVYIGASYKRRLEAAQLAEDLSPMMKIVSTWHRDDLEPTDRTGVECCNRAIRDFNQIILSQLVIIFIGDNLTGGGRHTELGIALGVRRQIMIIGDYDSNPFELIPYIRRFDCAWDLIKEFRSIHGLIEAKTKWREDQENRDVVLRGDQDVENL